MAALCLSIPFIGNINAGGLTSTQETSKIIVLLPILQLTIFSFVFFFSVTKFVNSKVAPHLNLVKQCNFQGRYTMFVIFFTVSGPSVHRLNDSLSVH